MDRLPNPMRHALTAQMALAVLIWSGLLAAWRFSGAPDVIDSRIVRPALFQMRAVAGKVPEPHPNLQVFAFDDTTFAQTGRSHLSAAQWVHLLRRLAATQPNSVAINHMFGSGELQEPGGQQLLEQLTEMQRDGIRVVGASFVYPGLISGRTPIQHASLRENPEKETTTSLSIFGPPPELAVHLTTIGHTAYRENGTTVQGIALGDQTVIEHMAIAIKPTLSPRTDRSGIDFSPSLHGKIRSMSTLLGDSPRSLPAGSDIVLLTDYFTGGSSFLATPIGMQPAGFVTAAAIDTHLRDRWMTTVPFGPLTALICLVIGWGLGYIRRPAVFAVSVVGTMSVLLASAFTIFQTSGIVLDWFSMGLAILGVSISGWFISQHFHQQHNRQRREQLERESSRLQAVVRTAQMFAHDVRKPFRLVQMAKETFVDGSRVDQMRDTIARLLPELESAITNVEQMTHDLMEFDGRMRLAVEVATLNTIIERAIAQVCRGKSSSMDVQFSYRFDHLAQLSVDSHKMQRVFANLIGNGIEACQGKGDIWIVTKDILDQNKTWVQVTVGNAGSYIAPEKRERIFEAFYTADKPGGTGLGLSIVKKIVEAHGGSIWCDSDPDRGTEFSLTLPIAETTPGFQESTQMLPAHSSDYSLPTPKTQSEASPITDGNRPLIAVIDDSDFTLQTWQAVVDDADLITFSSPTEFLAFAAEDARFPQVELIVTDLHFDNDVQNGFQLAKTLTDLTDSPIFLSSDVGPEVSDPAITVNIGKKPQSYARLRSHLPKAG